jgi:hypothetical protein
VHEAVLQHFREMTREDWLKSIEELSRAPEGVEDAWPPYDGPASNGSVQLRPVAERVTAKPKK